MQDWEELKQKRESAAGQDRRLLRGFSSPALEDLSMLLLLARQVLLEVEEHLSGQRSCLRRPLKHRFAGV